MAQSHVTGKKVIAPADYTIDARGSIYFKTTTTNVVGDLLVTGESTLTDRLVVLSTSTAGTLVVTPQSGSVPVYGSVDQRQTSGAYFAGGVGVELDLHVGGKIYGDLGLSSDTANLGLTTATSNSYYSPLLSRSYLETGTQLHTSAGGLEFNPVTGNLLAPSIGVTSNDPNSLDVTGGANIGGDLHIGGGLYVNGSIVTPNPSNGIEGDNLTIKGNTSQVIRGSSSTLLDYWAISGIRTVKYLVQLADGPSLHVVELLVFHDDRTPFINELSSTANNGKLGTFSVSIVANTLYFKFTPYLANYMIADIVKLSVIDAERPLPDKSVVLANYASSAITGTSPVVVESWDSYKYRTVQYIAQVMDGTDIHVMELTVFHDGINAHLINHSSRYNAASLGTFTVRMSGRLVVLSFTPTNATQLIVSLAKTSIISVAANNGYTYLNNDYETSNLQISGYTSNVVSSINKFVVENWDASEFRSIKYLAQITDNGRVQVTELVVFHDNVSAFVQTLTDHYTVSVMGAFNANVVNGRVVLDYTPISATALTVHLCRVAIVKTAKNAVLTKPKFAGYTDDLRIYGAVSTVISSSYPTTIDRWALTDFCTAKYIAQISDGTRVHVADLMLFHDGTSPFLDVYTATANNTGSLGTFSTHVVNDQVELVFTANSATQLIVNLVRRNLVKYTRPPATDNIVITTFNQTNIVGNSPVLLETWDSTKFRTAKYILQVVDGGNIYFSEILLYCTSGAVYTTEYGILTNNGPLGVLSAQLVATDLVVEFTPTSAVNMSVTLVRVGISGLDSVYSQTYITNSSPTNNVQVYGSANGNISGGSPVIVDIWDSFEFTSCKYLVQLLDGDELQTYEMTVTHDGSSAYYTYYGAKPYSLELGVFDIALVAGEVTVTFTPVNAQNMLVYFTKTAMLTTPISSGKIMPITDNDYPGLTMFGYYSSINPFSTVVIDSWPVATSTSAQYFIQVTSGTKVYVFDLVLVHNNGQVIELQYGTVNNSGDLGAFNAQVVGGNIELSYTNNQTAVSYVNLYGKLIK